MGPDIRRTRAKAKRVLETEPHAIRFVNTVAWRLRESPEERLSSAEALLEWLGANGIGDKKALEELSEAWRSRPAEGAAFYEMAVRFRETIYDILVAKMRGIEPLQPSLALFNELLASPRPGLRLEWDRNALVWRMRHGRASPFDLLGPVAFSASELMTGVKAGKVRQCEDDRGCGWVFVDESRAQRRRWCSMGDCGNRAKARRHYRRVRSPFM
jgi:predicted RNA-binding Zn ribbon-like protein